MKTKDFIKMLQEADPSGEGYIRMPGGVPLFAESKAGYWDGAYQYIDEEGNFVTSTNHYKVDIATIDVMDFVERYVNIHDPDNWSKIEQKFKFNLTYCVEAHRNERIDRVLKEAREAYDELSEIDGGLYQKYLEEMLANADKGWTWFQNKDVDKNELPNYHVFYTWKIFDENGKAQGSNVAHTESVLKSGLWEKLDNNQKPGYYQWIKKSNN